MTAHDSKVIEANFPKIHWFGDPADDETSEELLLINKYFGTADDIQELAMAANEGRPRARTPMRQRTPVVINFPSR